MIDSATYLVDHIAEVPAMVAAIRLDRLPGIPDTVTQVALLPFGFYTGSSFTPAARRPAREITYFNRWKQLG